MNQRLYLTQYKIEKKKPEHLVKLGTLSTNFDEFVIFLSANGLGGKANIGHNAAAN